MNARMLTFTLSSSPSSPSSLVRLHPLYLPMLLSDRFLATPTGQKRVKEDWENIYYYGFGGTCLLTAIGLYYKRDTSCVSTKPLQGCTRADILIRRPAESRPGLGLRR